MCVCVMGRCDSEESIDTAGLMSSSYNGVMNPRASSSASAAADAASQSLCPVLTNESDDVQQFLTSHAVNGGIVDLLIAYLTELSQRCHLTWWTNGSEFCYFFDDINLGMCTVVAFTNQIYTYLALLSLLLWTSSKNSKLI